MRDCVARCVRRYQFNLTHIPRVGSFFLPLVAYVTLFIALYYYRFKDQLDGSDTMAELEKYYSVHVPDPELAEKFVQLQRDEGTDHFIQWCVFSLIVNPYQPESLHFGPFLGCFGPFLGWFGPIWVYCNDTSLVYRLFISNNYM